MRINCTNFSELSKSGLICDFDKQDSDKLSLVIIAYIILILCLIKNELILLISKFKTRFSDVRTEWTEMGTFSYQRV